MSRMRSAAVRIRWTPSATSRPFSIIASCPTTTARGLLISWAAALASSATEPGEGLIALDHPTVERAAKHAGEVPLEQELVVLLGGLGNASAHLGFVGFWHRERVII